MRANSNQPPRSKKHILLALIAAATLGLASCDDGGNESKPTDEPKASNRGAADEIIRRTQEPQDRARAAEEQILEAERRRLETIDNL